MKTLHRRTFQSVAGFLGEKIFQLESGTPLKGLKKAAGIPNKISAYSEVFLGEIMILVSFSIV